MAGCGPPDTRSCVRAVSTMGPNRVWILILRSPALRTSNYSECLALPRKTPVSWRFSLVDRTRLTGNNLTPFCARQKKVKCLPQTSEHYRAGQTSWWKTWGTGTSRSQGTERRQRTSGTSADSAPARGCARPGTDRERPRPTARGPRVS